MSKDKEGMYKKATILKLATRIVGIRDVYPVDGIGDSIKENIDGLYLINSEKNEDKQRVPNEFTLYNGITTKLVRNPDSYFSLKKLGDTHYLFSDFVEEPLLPVEFTKRPIHYGKITSKGTQMMEVGQGIGVDTLAIASRRQCSFFARKVPCKYCNISGTKNTSKLPIYSQLEDIAETVSLAGKDFDFFAVTGGTFEDTNEECRHYTRIGEVIRDNLSADTFSGPFSLTPPRDLDLLRGLHETGVDVISFNIDVWDDNALKNVCPGKYEIGKNHYEKALKEGVRLWGEGNSTIQFLAGPWESNESLLKASKYFLNRGILPNITSYFPSPKSPLSKIGRPKTLKEILDLYIDYGHMVRDAGLFPNKRGTIHTSPSGNRSSIANEAARGYLTKENFNPKTDLVFAGGNK
ncbi:MAG: radical SAM protein [Nanoarchaeota archaeon]